MGHSSYTVERDGMWKNSSSEFVSADGHLHRCTLDLEYHKWLRTMNAVPQRAYHLLWFFVQLRLISPMASPFLCGFTLGMCATQLHLHSDIFFMMLSPYNLPSDRNEERYIADSGVMWCASVFFTLLTDTSLLTIQARVDCQGTVACGELRNRLSRHYYTSAGSYSGLSQQ